MAEARWFYLSFANETDFLGGCIVQAETSASAKGRAESLGLTPASCDEVLVVEIPDDLPQDIPAPSSICNRLLSRADIERLLGPVERVITFE